jgi:hypothetical protein
MNEIVNSVATINGWKDFNKTVVRKTIAGSIKVSDPFVGGYQLIPEIKIFRQQGWEYAFGKSNHSAVAKLYAENRINFL